MVARNSSSSYKLWNFISVYYRHRVLCATSINDNSLLSSKIGYGRDTNQGLRFFSSSAGSYQKLEAEKGKEETSSKVPTLALSAPPNYSLFSWVKWLMGSFLSILIPFSRKQKLETLPGLEGEPLDRYNVVMFYTRAGKVAKMIEEAEEVVEVVEKIATITEKASEVVVDILPDSCKFKQSALVIEHVSNVIVQDAEQTKNFINKVEDLKQDIEALEEIFEPVISSKVVQMENMKI